MKCLIIDKVYAGIAEELSKYMEVMHIRELMGGVEHSEHIFLFVRMKNWKLFL